MHLIKKIIRSPMTMYKLLRNEFFIKLYLKYKNVSYGKNCFFNGFPLIRMTRLGSINIGNNVVINSDVFSNPLGLNHKTVLSIVGEHGQITIGDNSGISGASIVSMKKIEIGKNVNIGVNSCIWDTDFHSNKPLNEKEELVKSSSVKIHDNVFIGANTTILKGVTIGSGAVVAAGSIVVKNVRPKTLVAGNPAEEKKTIQN
tara:strand:- start:1213 stop:1815 length:603 start_codon:yes stop_codon:yes gene_type:complete